MLRTLSHELIMRERVKTSQAKAKELRPLIEHMITAAKAGNLASRRLLSGRVPDAAARKLTTDLAKRFGPRPGGYTRIIRLPPRTSDASRMAIIEFVQ